MSEELYPSKEQEVAQWVVSHGETCLEALQERVNPNYKLLPDFAFEIFVESYSDEAMRLLKEGVMSGLNLNNTDLELFFNKSWIIMLLGKDVLVPPKTEVDECHPEKS
jgi:hypothetical protein